MASKRRAPRTRQNQTSRQTPTPSTARPWLSAPILGGIAALVVVVVVAIFFLTREPGGGATTSGSIEGVQTFSNLSSNHRNGSVTYAQTPPAGGDHASTWQNCGVYTEPIQNELGVHSLEHGAVWITYRPDLPAAEVQALSALARQSGYRLLSPYPGLPSPIVISAWGAQLRLEQASDPRLNQFIVRYEQDPAGPEPGAPCTGGQGRPNG